MITGIPAGKYPVRVEFSNLPGYARQGTPRGTDGNTTVQFIASNNCNVDLGVLNNVDYCDDEPPIFVPCYVNGDPLAGGGAGSADAFVRFDYDASGAKDPSKMDVLASASEVGSLWGVAHNKYTNRIFTSATIKRHVGMGPEGLGGIYVLNPNVAGVVTSWNVNTDFGINVGTLASNATRGLGSSLSAWSVDNQGFTSIGKVGIGDIDITENGNQLYMVNLFDKKVYRIDLTGYNTSATTPSTDANWTIPDPGCTNGQFRPFALKWYKGQVYVGAVCDASSGSGTKSNLRAYVYRLNPLTSVWTTIFDFPLTYPKGFPTADDRTATGWFPWTDDFNDFIITNTSSNRDDVVYPQPMFTDLEIDVDGTLVLGFGDRGAMQTGYRNQHPGGDNGRQYTGYVGGDVLRAFNNGTGRFVLENASKAGPNMGYDPDNNQGPGFGEYYNDDWFNGDATPKLRHSECVIGGLALRPGSGQIIVTHVDPVDGISWSGGVRHYNNTTGLTDYGFVLYRTTGGTANDAGTQGKAAGLGDIEVGCALPTFIEIGNRVWVDADNDGTQDPDESPLSGVRVQLYKQDGTLIATTLTNSSGEYYFSSSNPQMADPNLNWVGTGMDAMIQPSSPYYLVFGSSQYSGGQLVLGGNNYNLTVPNNESPAPANNSNDSDATLVSGLPRITINASPIEGAVNHTYDVGFYLTPLCSVSITCNPSHQTNCTPLNGAVSTTVTGGQGNITYLWSSGETTASITGKASGTYTVTVTDDISVGCTSTCQTTINNNTTPPTVTCAKTDNSNCATPNGTATATATGVTYLWSNGGTTAMITGLSNATYTVTVTSTSTGCTNTYSAIVATTTTLPTATCTPMDNTNCATPNGSAMVTTNANQILWSTGAMTASITGLSAGTYTVTVTNTTTSCTNTCQAIVGSTVTPPTVTCAKTDNSNCATPNGTATATATGVTYLWSNGGTTAMITGLSNTTYTVTVTSTTTGCTNTCSAIVATTTTLPTATCTPMDNTNCATPNGSATVTTNANQILWSTGATTASITGLSAGIYSVTVTNTTTSCTNTCQAIVGSTVTPPTVTCAKTDNSNCATPNGTATATATGVTYLWSNGGTTAMITGLSNATYTVTVTSTSTGCTNTCSAIVATTTTLPTATCTPMDNTNCATPNGSAMVTTNANQILWSTGATTANITGLSAGTYTVTVTNTTTSCTNTCQAIVGSTVTPPTVTCAKTDNSNCATPNGTATATATGVTYLWSNGGTTSTITGLSNATYTVTVTSTTTGCTNTCSAIVATTTTLPTATCTPMDNTNCATPNGSAMVTTNANQILWSTGATTANITGLSAGTYTVTVTNTTTSCTNTCQAIVGSTVTPPTVTCAKTDNSNCATPNGTATATATGVTYLWSNGGTTSMITGLSNATYTVTVTSTTTGCTATCSAMVASNLNPPSCTITQNSEPTCSNSTNGSVTVNVSNGTAPFSYNWGGGIMGSTRMNLGAGTYTVTVTDFNNCSTTCSTTFNAPTGCCAINPITLLSNECDDNGTLSKITDNRMLVGILVTNLNNSLSNFTVSVNGGTTINPTTGTYGVPQVYTLGPGTAGGGATFRITVTDQVTGTTCQGFIDVIGNVQCTGGLPNDCPTPKCGTATIQVNGN